jgi:hypothetical protein
VDAGTSADSWALEVRQIVSHDGLDQLGLQGIASTLEWIAIL